MIKGTRAEIQDACAPYGYHPLALRLLAGLIVKDHRKPRDISVASRHPVSTEMLLQSAYDALEQPKRDLLKPPGRLPQHDEQRLLGNPEPISNRLAEALTRCRRVNLIELEPNILLALARLHRDPNYAREALAIADRRKYRLVQADCHNVLARLVPEQARFHAQKAYGYAWCDGPPSCYKPALDEAQRLLSGEGN